MGRTLRAAGPRSSVSKWDITTANGPFGERDSAHGAEFAGHLWLSGGYNDPTGTASCFNTCSYFDLWGSTDLTGTSWPSSANFATVSTPNPRDTSPIENNGVQDAPVPTDFYDSYSALVVWNNRLLRNRRHGVEFAGWDALGAAKSGRRDNRRRRSGAGIDSH